MVLATPMPKDFEKSRERLLKPCQLDKYTGKPHIECYNFIQLYKDYFTISGDKSHNRVLFVMGYLKNRVINKYHQQKRKVVVENSVSIICNKFKIFL